MTRVVLIMSKEHLPLIILVCLFLFGCVVAGSALAGMRSGRFWYRNSWLTKGGDGILFWLGTSMAAMAGTGVAVGAVWFLIEHRVRILAPW